MKNFIYFLCEGLKHAGHLILHDIRKEVQTRYLFNIQAKGKQVHQHTPLLSFVRARTQTILNISKGDRSCRENIF